MQCILDGFICTVYYARIREFVEKHAEKYLNARCRYSSPLVASDISVSAMDAQQLYEFLGELASRLRPPNEHCSCSGCCPIFHGKPQEKDDEDMDSLTTSTHKELALRQCLEEDVYPAVDVAARRLSEVARYNYVVTLMLTGARDVMCTVESSLSRICNVYASMSRTKLLPDVLEECKESSSSVEPKTLSYQQLWMFLYDFGISPSMISLADIQDLSFHCRQKSLAPSTGCSHDWRMISQGAPNNRKQ